MISIGSVFVDQMNKQNGCEDTPDNFRNFKKFTIKHNILNIQEFKGGKTNEET